MSFLNDAVMIFVGICIAIAYPAPALAVRDVVISKAKAMWAKVFPPKA